MILYFFSLIIVDSSLQNIGSYQLSETLNDKLFQVTKEINSNSMLLIASVDSEPYFEFDESLDC